MKKILAISLFAIVAVFAFATTFSEAMNQAILISGGYDELIIQGDPMIMIIIPVNRMYIDSGFAFPEIKGILKAFIGSHAMAFVFIENNTPDMMRINPDFISFDGKYGESFINSDIAIADYVDIYPFSSNWGFLIVDPYSDYPVIKLADRYVSYYPTLYSERSFIHRYIMDAYKRR